MYEDNKIIGENADLFLFCLTALKLESFSERKKVIDILFNFDKNYSNFNNSNLSYGVEKNKNLILTFKINDNPIITFKVKNNNCFTVKINDTYKETIFLFSMFYIYGNNDVVDVISKNKNLEEINFDISYINLIMANIAGIINIENKNSKEVLHQRLSLIFDNINNLKTKEFYFSNRNKGNLNDEESNTTNSENNIFNIDSI